MVNGLLALVPLILFLLTVYAFFSIAIDVRVIGWQLERQAAEHDARTP